MMRQLLLSLSLTSGLIVLPRGDARDPHNQRNQRLVAQPEAQVTIHRVSGPNTEYALGPGWPDEQYPRQGSIGPLPLHLTNPVRVSAAAMGNDIRLSAVGEKVSVQGHVNAGGIGHVSTSSNMGYETRFAYPGRQVVSIAQSEGYNAPRAQAIADFTGPGFAGVMAENLTRDRSPPRIVQANAGPRSQSSGSSGRGRSPIPRSGSGGTNRASPLNSRPSSRESSLNPGSGSGEAVRGSTPGSRSSSPEASTSRKESSSVPRSRSSTDVRGSSPSSSGI